MRGDAVTGAARRTRDRAPVPACARLALAASATLVLAFLFPASPASAGLYHPKPPVASFGPLGGACAEGDLATGTGDLTSGSKEITSVAATCGAFEVGQEISATGISGAITAVGSGTLTVSSAAGESGSGVALATTSKFGSNVKFFGHATQLAFDQTAHRLYAVEENGLSELFGFDVSTPGAYEPLGAPFPLSVVTAGNNQTSLAVDDSGGPTQGNIYTATENNYGDNKIHGFDSAGNPLPGFPIASPEPGVEGSAWTALAVDPDGNVWGANAQDFTCVAYEYSPTGTLLDTVRLPGVFSTKALSLAFAANGDLYVDNEDGLHSAVWKLSAPAYDHPVPFVEGVIGELTVDRAAGDLYVASANSIFKNSNRVLRFGSDGTLLEEFAGGLGPDGEILGVAIDEATGAVYVSTNFRFTDSRVSVFEGLVLPDLATAPISNPAETAATLHGSVGPSGVPLTGCRFEWVSEAAFQATGFTSLSSGGERACSPAFGSIPVSGQTGVSAAITGLAPGVTYRYRLSAENVNGLNTTKGLPASFALGKPVVETVGSPVRTATTARLDSRVDPHGIPTTYRFQYISDAAYQANLAGSLPPFEGAVETAARSAGGGGLIELVSQPVEGLAPATTYRYRVLADNGAFGGPAAGEVMGLTTRASDAPLSHGRFSGPSGSDRAWEQVNAPDTGGNPVVKGAGISDDGERAVYQVAGGTPLSQAGTLSNFFFAQRPAGEHPERGWQTLPVYPSRAAATFSAWFDPSGDNALSSLLAINTDFENEGGAAVWRIPTEGGAPAKLYEAPHGQYESQYIFSDDGSRALLVLKGSALDPEHHSPGGARQLYDVSSGVPRMVSLLPGNTAPSCGVTIGSGSPFELHVGNVARSTHWVSADGSHAFFPSAGNGGCATRHLYMRDFTAGESFRVDGPPLEGPDCSGAMIRSSPQAAYFWTQSKLAPEDTAITGSCGITAGGDVYRYDLASHALKCLTCVVPGGAPANVLDEGQEGHTIAVAPDGSRVYFTTETRLLPGTAEAGTPGLYRVDVPSASLAYVAPLNRGEEVGEEPTAFSDQGVSATSSPDGRFLVFASSSPGLDALTDSDNANTVQDYIYDDASGSLSCASCSPDGSAPRADATKYGGVKGEVGPNVTPLAEDGDFAFATPTALVAADQNTAPAGKDASAGTDIYEWRDGRALLVSDGLTDWPGVTGEGPTPRVAAISPSGRDLFFTEAARLTTDAPDGYTRLYDARVGGGIEFPPAAKPCPLEVCQGTPKSAPEEPQPGSVFFSGPGNLTPPALTTLVPVKPKLTRSQLLAKALRACNKKPRKKRAACLAQARRRYGPKKARKATNPARRTAP